ncbi:protocadherin beta-15-like [Nematolebias whitei]|uniref:protocadherin beta-15-like n=1 Tax=Nematolebias whitei TaxID=451745 RepID=UPI001899A9D1|nr:protocadherin beta-15-like [Nematolebias whitei]
MEQRRAEACGQRRCFLGCALAVLLCRAAFAQIRYSISEEVNEGVAVGNIAKDLGLEKSTLTERKYRIVSGGASPPFHVNQNDGVLYVSRHIDREELCEHSTSCVLNLKTVLENPLEIHYVAVQVLDLNDHSPSFPDKEKTLEISESALPGVRIPLPPARDPDVGPFSVQHYKLSSSDHFRLEVKDKGEDGKIPILTVLKSLDREAQIRHSLVLTALDGGKPPKSGEMQIIINVLDINDNAPIFSQDEYSVMIDENAPIGTLVLQLNATDLDEGPNGEVVYSFSSMVNEKILKLFDINPTTGEITVKGNIDFEGRDRYEIEIQASDRGLSPLSTQKSVVIKIVDVNDNAPEIEVTSFSSSIPEDSRPGTTVALISVNDLDSGLNGKVICSISDDVTFSLAPSLQDKMFSLVIKSLLDREKQSNYVITVVAKDAGQPSLLSEKTINMVVSDVNDNRPEFLMSPYTFYIKENNDPGASVFSVKAYDQDENENAHISYLIKRDGSEERTLASFLNINSETGDIVALKSFDFEILKTFHFQVVATDSGAPRSAGIIHGAHDAFVMDLRKRSEMRMEQRGRVRGHFSGFMIAVVLWCSASAQLRYSISEEVYDGTVAGNIAKDLGIDKNTLKDRKYRIVSSDVDPLFYLNENDGIMYVRRRIDREEVCEQGSRCVINLKTVLENPLEVHYVEVEILDLNDHSPDFLERNTTLEISESVLPGARFQLKPAKDPDSGQFSVQQYKLSQNDHFRLEVKDKRNDIKIPVLVVQKSLDRETAKSHSLILTALDGGKPPKSGNMTILINVLDINDNAPIFSQGEYSVTLKENAAVGTTVIQVNATDLDHGLNGDVTFSFSNNVNKDLLNLFEISAEGEITVKGVIDYEDKDEYELEVQATDKGLAPLTAEKSIIIKIIDMNDNTPEIEVTSFSNSIPEDSRPGTTVALISVNDLDSGLNGKVICTVSEDGPFTLSPTLKDKMFSLVTRTHLDREKESKYVLTIIATDAGQPPLSAERTINLVVSDVNDNRPEFLMSPYSFYITEGNNPGASVFSVKVYVDL